MTDEWKKHFSKSETTINSNLTKEEKEYKQKQLLEDAQLIYKLIRSPENIITESNINIDEEKIYKQKQLLEEAYIGYKIENAQTRSIFHINTKNMPPEEAKQFIEQLKNEIYEKKNTRI